MALMSVPEILFLYNLWQYIPRCEYIVYFEGKALCFRLCSTCPRCFALDVGPLLPDILDIFSNHQPSARPLACYHNLKRCMLYSIRPPQLRRSEAHHPPLFVNTADHMNYELPHRSMSDDLRAAAISCTLNRCTSYFLKGFSLILPHTAASICAILCCGLF